MDILLQELEHLLAQKEAIEKIIAATSKLIDERDHKKPVPVQVKLSLPRAPAGKKNIPIFQAAHNALALSVVPLSTVEILDKMNIKIGGNRPIVALNSILTRKPKLFCRTADRKWTLIKERS
jgi:hypothetical protein